MFGNELRLKAAVAVTRDVDGQGTKISLERLGTAAVACVTALVRHGFVLVVTQVGGQLGLQGALHNGLGELL